LVNQPFILDLGPDNSLIKSFVDNGYDVYLLEFGIPGYEDKDLDLDDYIIKYIQKGVQRALLHSGEDAISLMGFCLGGTLAAIYTSLANEPIKNLILSVTPIDFHHFPIFSEWLNAIKKDQMDFDSFIDAWGLIPPSFIEAGVRLLTSPVYFTQYLSLLNRSYDEEYTQNWSRFNLWTKSHIPFPGAAIKQLSKEFVKQNKLVNGGLLIGGKPANLANITANLLAVGASGDKLVPKQQVSPIIDLVSSKDKTLHLLAGGHANLTENGKMPSYLSDWLSVRSISI
jgi:polyhydroxyalkanoate synthase subunit PhaC